MNLYFGGNLREFSIDSIKQNDSYYQEHLHSANEALKRSKELLIIIDSYKSKKRYYFNRICRNCGTNRRV